MHLFCKPKGTDIPSTCISLSTSHFGRQDSDSLRSGENLLLDWRPLASVVFSIPMLPWLKGGWVSCFSCSFHQMFNRYKVREQRVPLSPSFSPSWQRGCGGHSGSFHGVRSLYDSRQKQRTQTRTRDSYELQDLFLMAHFLQLGTMFQRFHNLSQIAPLTGIQICGGPVGVTFHIQIITLVIHRVVRRAWQCVCVPM